MTKKALFCLTFTLMAAALPLAVRAQDDSVPPAGAAEPESPPLQPLETVDVGESPTATADRLHAVESYLNDITSLKARFVQQAPDGSLSRGVMYILRPGHVRFQYDGDVPVLIVGDGKTLNLIDYEVGQVTRWPIEDTPLNYLVGGNISFADRDIVVAAGPGVLANMISVTAEDPKRPDHGTITLVFSSTPGDGAPKLQLRAWQVIDAQGGMTTVTLFDTEVNPKVSDALWTFDDPRGERYRRSRRH